MSDSFEFENIFSFERSECLLYFMADIIDLDLNINDGHPGMVYFRGIRLLRDYSFINEHLVFNKVFDCVCLFEHIGEGGEIENIIKFINFKKVVDKSDELNDMVLEPEDNIVIKLDELLYAYN